MHDAVFDPCGADALTFSGERLDDLQLGGLHILQRPDGFCFGVDAVLLADFARIGQQASVVDLGTGTGILPLLLWGRGKGASFEAFELSAEMADMARRTMVLNGLTDRVHIHAAAAEEAPRYLPAHSMDAVVCNPPYGVFGAQVPGEDPLRRLARHQQADGLSAWLRAAQRVLRGKGRISLIYPTAGMLSLMRMMEDARLTPKRFRLVYPREDRPARLALVEGVYQGKEGLQPEPPLILQDAEGQMTDEVRRIYHQA